MRQLAAARTPRPPPSCDTPSMAVTDEDEERAVRVVLADVKATLGAGHESIVRDIAARLREFIEDPTWYFERVVEDTQQDFHDGYIDTDWPKCPLHDGRHPLWLGEGGWWCQKDGVRIAAVGDLASTIVPEST